MTHCPNCNDTRRVILVRRHRNVRERYSPTLVVRRCDCSIPPPRVNQQREANP